MKVRVNGQERELTSGTTIGQLLEAERIPAFCVVALNAVCLGASERGAALIREGDEIEILVPHPGG